MRQFSILAASVWLLAITGPAFADGQFASVPALDGKKNTLKIRQVDFSGGASGHIVVEVRNDGKQTQDFEARGLYFVPKGNAAGAPQRVGAAGPFEMQDGNGWQSKKQLKIEPGKTVRLRLATFCLDSHRGSPGKGQGFGVAQQRLPKELSSEIESGAGQMIRAKGGKAADAQGDIQSHVWKTRNKKWIKLEGERANEKGAESSEQQLRRPLPQSSSQSF